MTVLQRGPTGARVTRVERLVAPAVDPPITDTFLVVR